MKKLIFSAIAMMAFMGSSMGKTVEKTNNDSNNKTTEKEETVADVDCNGVRISTKLEALGLGASSEIANAVAWSAFYECMSLTKPKTTLK